MCFSLFSLFINDHREISFYITEDDSIVKTYISPYDEESIDIGSSSKQSLKQDENKDNEDGRNVEVEQLGQEDDHVHNLKLKI